MRRVGRAPPIAADIDARADRRKAAAVTNEIRRAKRELFEQERINRELEEMFAKREARLRRKREQAQARRDAEAAQARLDRGFPYVTY
jgi:primosomal protein N''